MKRINLFSLMIFLMMISCSASEKDTAVLNSKAKLEVEGGASYDWGKVHPIDSPLKTKIKLYNRGSDTLHIIKVKPGCGCTTAPIDKEYVEPGGYATLDISLTLSNTTQSVHKMIEISTNDPVNEKFVLHLKCEVIAPITFFPNKYLSFGIMHIGKETRVKLILTNETDSDIYLKDIQLEPALLKTNIRNNDIIHAKGDLELIVTVIPTSTGPFKGTVKFNTSDTALPHVEIIGDGSVVGE
jgi:hypothetical protein